MKRHDCYCVQIPGLQLDQAEGVLKSPAACVITTQTAIAAKAWRGVLFGPDAFSSSYIHTKSIFLSRLSKPRDMSRLLPGKCIALRALSCSVRGNPSKKGAIYADHLSRVLTKRLIPGFPSAPPLERPSCMLQLMYLHLPTVLAGLMHNGVQHSAIVLSDRVQPKGAAG